LSVLLCELIDQSFRQFGQRAALVQHQAMGEASVLTFKELEALAGKAYSLFGDDLEADQSIGLYMQRTVEHVAAIVASLYSKSPYTTINNLVSARQVCHIAQDSNLKVLICDNSTLLKLRALTKEEADKKVLSTIRIVHFRQTEVLQPVHQQTVDLLAKFTQVQSIMLDNVKPHALQVPAPETVNQAKLILLHMD